MRPEDLVFWLDVLVVGDDDRRGVLCRRHADTMVVPRGWTLDDLREPDLRLFRPPPPAPEPAAGVPLRRRRPAAATTAEQLPLEGPTPKDRPTDPEVEPSADPVATPWSPNFDDADDLGGLLAARSPLLARAFNGADRQRNT